MPNELAECLFFSIAALLGAAICIFLTGLSWASYCWLRKFWYRLF
jgi:hypothetical protein